MIEVDRGSVLALLYFLIYPLLSICVKMTIDLNTIMEFRCHLLVVCQALLLAVWLIRGSTPEMLKVIYLVYTVDVSAKQLTRTPEMSTRSHW